MINLKGLIEMILWECTGRKGDSHPISEMGVREIFMETVIFGLNFEGWIRIRQVERNTKTPRESRECDKVIESGICKDPLGRGIVLSGWGK